MFRPVLILGDPLLRRKSAPVDDFSDPALKDEMRDLKEALERFRREHGFGRGIAAPQIGIPKRMIALNLGQGTFVIANPLRFCSAASSADIGFGSAFTRLVSRTPRPMIRMLSASFAWTLP